MKEISYNDQQEYISGIREGLDSEATLNPISKDLMNPEAADSLEVETDGKFLYSEAQVDSLRPNHHEWHGWATASVSGESGYGGAVRTVLLSGSHAELKALDVDSTITADDINAGHDITVGHNLYVKNDAGVKGTLVISENADDPGYLDDISDDTGLYIDETKEENHIHNLEVVNLTASKADFDSGSFGDLEARDLRVTHSLQVSGSTVLSGSTEVTGNFSVDGPAFFQTTSVFRKDVYISGNLYVENSASYINTDQLYIEDKSITVASGAISPNAANGAGFDIDGAGVTFHYKDETDQMELNKGLFVDGNISASGVVVVPSGSIDDLASKHIVTTELTASYAQFNSASGYFTGSFSGDGSGLTGVTMSVSDAPKCKHVLNIAPGGTERITHPFNTQNVIVQVYRWENPDYVPDYQSGGEEGAAGGEDEVPAEVWDNPAIQVFDENKISVIVRPVDAEDPQNPYCVDIVNRDTEDFNGYVVIADAGIYLPSYLSSSGSLVLPSGSIGYVDIVEATREVIWFGSNPSGLYNPDNISYIPQNGSASVYAEISKGVEYTFEHALGTGNIIAQVYRYYPRYDENDPTRILGWSPVKFEPEYITILNSGSVGIMFSTPDSGSFENGVQEEYDEIQNCFGYVVLVKAGSVVKSFEISEDAIGYFNIHWGNTGSWEAKSFTATNMSAEFLDSNDIVAKRVDVEEYIDTPMIGNLNRGYQHYYDYYGYEGDPEPDVEHNKLWGTFIEFDDGQITFHLRSGSAGESKMITASVLTSDGDLYLAGDLIPNHSSFALSDEREKDNIQILTGSLENLMKLRGVSFEWHDGTKSIGTIAQEVRSIYPELTKITKNVEGEERIFVNYEGLTGVLIEAVKTLANKVESLTQRIEQLEKNENR